jgi:hypothetical protein
MLRFDGTPRARTNGSSQLRTHWMRFCFRRSEFTWLVNNRCLSWTLNGLVGIGPNIWKVGMPRFSPEFTSGKLSRFGIDGYRSFKDLLRFKQQRSNHSAFYELYQIFWINFIICIIHQFHPVSNWQASSTFSSAPLFAGIDTWLSLDLHCQYVVPRMQNHMFLSEFLPFRWGLNFSI